MPKTAPPELDDPAPQAPPEPDLDACCGQGCAPCVFDLYEAALGRYRSELQAWQERQARRSKLTSGASRRRSERC
jgi:hypothetical protein